MKIYDELYLVLESEPDSFGSKEYVFNPEFTNQIYRQEEEIYGYKDLEVNIHLLSGSLYPHLNVKYTDKAPDADNLEECLMEAFTDGNA
jgi:histone acetyltransferase 1